MNTIKRFAFVGVLVLVGAVGIGYLVVENNKPGTYDAFAQCLEDKGALFYGTFWCPYCQQQKKMFGKSEKLLPYVECSSADGKQQLQACKDKDVQGYPTWDFTDGSRERGVLSFSRLAEKTGCQLQ